MENIMNNPVIGVVMCRNRLKGHATQTLQEKYLNAIIHAGGLPFALGVQWHPEWNSSEYALSRILFEGFITACQHHIAEKQRL
ncbi:TPA: hypothetical protein ROB00_002856 [Escherichia coli]|nr:hypothetical protein [Escherichia coli]